MSTGKRRSTAKTQERIAQLGWEPTYHESVAGYHAVPHPRKVEGPMKQIMAANRFLEGEHPA